MHEYAVIDRLTGVGVFNSAMFTGSPIGIFLTQLMLDNYYIVDINYSITQNVHGAYAKTVCVHGL